MQFDQWGQPLDMKTFFQENGAAPAPRATIADQWYNPSDLLLRVLLKNHKLDRDPLV